ncbi:hypothetical protein J6590_059597 [Homalodisca vitripennis]|nr:hypothetical protein J6590_059597 [Homalodisca vitripennis]
MRFAAKDLICGRLKIGDCTTTMRQLILPNFFGETRHSASSLASVLSRYGSMRFLALPPPQKTIEGTRFESQEAIMKKTTADLMAMPKSDFQDCFQKWKRRWNHCVASQGRRSRSNVRRATSRANRTDDQQETDNDNSHIGMAHLRSTVNQNEVDRQRMQRVRAHRSQQREPGKRKLTDSANAMLL